MAGSLPAEVREPNPGLNPKDVDPSSAESLMMGMQYRVAYLGHALQGQPSKNKTGLQGLVETAPGTLERVVRNGRHKEY